MRKLLFLFLLFFAMPAFADTGVQYQVYRAGGATPCFGCGQILNSGTVSNINFNWGGGMVMNSGLYDGVEIHFTGYMTVPGSGSQYITFYDYSDDGFILNVGGQRVISNWQEQGPGYWNGTGGIYLQGGTTYVFDVWYYENGGGAAVSLYWNQSGSITLIPNTGYTTTMPNPKAFGDGGATLPTTSITSAEQTKINQTTTIGYNTVYIEQYNGNYTNVNITQTGDFNAVRGSSSTPYYINGGYNTLTVTQGSQSTLGYHNLLEGSVTGNSNNLTVSQQGSNNYEQTLITGSSNTLNTTQSGNSKSLFATIDGSSNNITTSQTGTGNHFLELNIPTTSNTVNVTQSGSAQKLFSLTLNNNNIGVTVTQDNATTTDSAAMSITCTSGSCSGYTYTKH